MHDPRGLGEKGVIDAFNIDYVHNTLFKGKHWHTHKKKLLMSLNLTK